jgi:hypothetical protein
MIVSIQESGSSRARALTRAWNYRGSDKKGERVKLTLFPLVLFDFTDELPLAESTLQK